MTFKNPFRREQKTSRATSLLVQFGKNEARFTPRQYDKLADEAYRKNIIAYRAIKLVSQNAAAVPFAVFKGKGVLRLRLEDHPLQKLLSQPNPTQGSSEFLESLYAFFLIAGNSYIEAVGPKGDAPRELWCLRPDRMRVVAGDGGIPGAYRYSIAGKSVDFAVDPFTGQADILHVKSFHPLDDWYGMSPLEAAAFSVDQHNEAARWNASLLQSSGRPSGALVFKPAHPEASDVLTDEQRQALKNEIEAYYTGGANAGKPLVLEGGLDWREMSMSPKDMDWLAGKDVSAREIALAFHVPPQLIGIQGSLSFANFEQARLSLYDDAVLPLVAHVREELNNWLCPRFGSDITVDFDTDKIEALIPRREKVWERVNASTFMTVNEKRVALGLSPMDGFDTISGKE